MPNMTSGKVHRRKLSRREKKTTVAAYLFLAPAIILFLLFFYVPMTEALYYSFNEYNVLSPVKWVGLANYIDLFHNPVFIQAVKNTCLYLLIIVPSLVILPLLLAQLVNRKMRGMYLFRLLFYMPYVTSAVAIGIVWKFLYHPEGLINSALRLLGFFQETVPANWLFDPKTALVAVALVEVWKAAGYYMVIYLAALQTVPQELSESAYLDGATSRQVMWHITIPCIRPQIMVTLILSTMSAIKIFDSVYIMTGGGPLNSTISLPMYIYQEGFRDLNMGYASAIGIVMWIALMGLSYLNFRFNGKETMV